MIKLKTDKIKNIIIHITMFLVAIAMIFPIFWMLLLSLKQYPESMNGIVEIVFSPFSFSNYKDVFISDDFTTYFINSMIIASIITISNILFCTMTGYVIARKTFKGKKIVMASILGLLIIPVHIVMIPLYKIMVSLNWIDTYWSLIIPWIVTPFGVFMLKQYIESLPFQIEDAARIDGAGEWYIFFKIVFPLCRPILTVLAIYIFINNWNSFLFPFIFTNSADYRTLPVGLTFYLGKQSIDWGHLMAGASISALPILVLFLFFQKKIIQSLTAGALK
ncbi:MAG: carbohydrate ABC transporter permease [Bacteroidetes bacterium]|nr:carbohydrate ABC transporter permease [Bacteroidota bacterium]